MGAREVMAGLAGVAMVVEMVVAMVEVAMAVEVKALDTQPLSGPHPKKIC